MMDLKSYAEKHGKTSINVFVLFVLFHLKREIKEDIVFITKAKTRKQNALLKQNLFD